MHMMYYINRIFESDLDATKRRPCEAKIPVDRSVIPVALMKKINILIRNGFKATYALGPILLLHLLRIEYFSH
jgi:hypothetical protein